eukprot:TRINITY_DN8921_c0_g1_i2.p2 TRINITY_DN8921_c0_g1~~TRINITY_DN8921_c0_g1_i2.p2  ORF type:complete len:162 (-),score=47.17 TRINITY_DN8921_c0_g1_i2:149-580(-)
MHALLPFCFLFFGGVRLVEASIDNSISLDPAYIIPVIVYFVISFFILVIFADICCCCRATGVGQGDVPEPAKSPSSPPVCVVVEEAGAVDALGDAACTVCLAEPRAVVLLPCRHLCACAGCAPRLAACPLCRGAVAARLEVYY